MMHSEHAIPVKIAYIGGGSLAWAPKLMADLAQERRLSAEVRLYDLDLEAAARNARIGTRFAAVSTGIPARYTVAQTLSDALSGADVVVVSILPGQFEDMAQDIDIPARYGIPQAVGDTVGPGGFVRAMRAIPMLAEIGRAIAEHAPKAWVCNLTNPMSTLTGALYAAFPGIQAWGECHEVTKIRHQVAWIANREQGEDRFTHLDVEVDVAGINHFTFAPGLSLAGRDMRPAYDAFVAEHAQTGWHQVEPGRSAAHARYFGSHCKVAFDLHRRFGVPGAAGDRHLAEFMPAAEYLNDPDRWGFALTPVAYRVQDRDAKIRRAEDLLAGRVPVRAKPTEEALVSQILALMTGGRFVSNVNLPNRGQMPGLPLGAIVETNATFSGLGITPMVASALPGALMEIVSDHAARQAALLSAVMHGDRPALFPLFASDPLVAPLGADRARTLFNEMTQATQKWLPDALKGAA